MAAADALIAMTAQRRGAAAGDGIEHLAMRPCKMRLLLFPETVARSRTMSATSRVGRLIASSVSWSASPRRGLETSMCFERTW